MFFYSRINKANIHNNIIGIRVSKMGLKILQETSAKIHVFDESFFLLNIRMPIVSKLFRVVTHCEDLPPINMHDISTDRSCGVK